MADQLAGIEGKFLLSLNDHPEVRRIFASFAMVTLNVSYSVGGGENTQHTTEVVISNIDQARLEQLLA